MAWTFSLAHTEHDLISLMKPKSIVNLEIGDIAYYLDGQLKCLVERKRVDDYVSSISDGRLKNQSIRIQSEKEINPNLIVIYLVEGSIPASNKKFFGGITGEAVLSSFIGKMVRDRFNLFIVNDINESVRFLNKLYDKLKSDYSDLTEYKLLTPQDYVRTIKTEKKANMTPEMCYICQLSQIPNVSTNTAEIIANKWSSMSSLVRGFMSYSGNPAEMLQVCDGIGKVMAKKIYEYIMFDGNKTEVRTEVKTEDSVKPKIGIKIKVNPERI